MDGKAGAQLPWPVQGSLHAKSRTNSKITLYVIGILLSWVVCTQILDIDIRVQFRDRHAKLKEIKSNIPQKYPCKPSLPFNLLQIHPPSSLDPNLFLPIQLFSKQVLLRAALPDIDSVTVGIVNTNGLIWSKGFGRARANGTEFNPPNEHTIYRIASISKLFATFEGFILRDRGTLHWDDPVQNHLSNFSYNAQGWKEYFNHRNSTNTESDPDPITLRQLASHMSGIGRDLPARNFDWWPKPPPDLPEPEPPKLPTLEQQLDSIAELPLVAPPYSFPSYSNTGFSVLGATLVAADGHATGNSSTYAQILERDIFAPLGMNGSSFSISDKNRPHLAIPRDTFDLDLTFPDSFNAAGGQFSSLSDLSKTVRSLLTSDRHHSLLASTSKREWLRPMHIFPDSLTETGLVWEIMKFPDSHNRDQRYYSKGGNLVYSHSEVTFSPQLQYGVIVLMTGIYPDAWFFNKLAVQLLQPAFEKILEKRARDRYAGAWRGEGDDRIVVEVKDGSLWITDWVANGIDWLHEYEGKLGDRVALWSTGRLDEFRVAIARPGLDAGCLPSWVTFDPLYSHQAPIDLIYFEETGDGLSLQFPSANVTMHR